MFTHLRKHQSMPGGDTPFSELPKPKWALVKSKLSAIAGTKDTSQKTGWELVAEALKMTDPEDLQRQLAGTSPDRDEGEDFKALRRGIHKSWKRTFQTSRPDSVISSPPGSPVPDPDDVFGLQAFEQVCEDIAALIQWAQDAGEDGLEMTVYQTKRRHTGSSFAPLIKAIRELPPQTAAALVTAVPALSKALGSYHDKGTQPFGSPSKDASPDSKGSDKTSDTPVLRFDDLKAHLSHLIVSGPKGQASSTDSPKTSPKKDHLMHARRDAVVAWCRLLVSRVQETQRMIEEQIQLLVNLKFSAFSDGALSNPDSRDLLERVASLIENTNVPEPLRRKAFDAVTAMVKQIRERQELAALSRENVSNRTADIPVDSSAFEAFNYVLSVVHNHRHFHEDSAAFEGDVLQPLWIQVIELSQSPDTEPDFQSLVRGCHHYGLLKLVCSNTPIDPLARLMEAVIIDLVNDQEANSLFRGSNPAVFMTTQYLDRASGNFLSQLVDGIRSEVVSEVLQLARTGSLDNIQELQAIAGRVYASQLVLFDWGVPGPPQELVSVMQLVAREIKLAPELSLDKTKHLYANTVVAGQDALLIFRSIASLANQSEDSEQLDEASNAAVNQVLGFIMHAMAVHSLMRPNGHAFARNPMMDSFMDRACGTTDRRDAMKAHFRSCGGCQTTISTSDTVDTAYQVVYREMYQEYQAQQQQFGEQARDVDTQGTGGHTSPISQDFSGLRTPEDSSPEPDSHRDAGNEEEIKPKKTVMHRSPSQKLLNLDLQSALAARLQLQQGQQTPHSDA